jgi:hypothetical protein
MNEATLTPPGLPASRAVRFEPSKVVWDLITSPGGEAVYHRLTENEPAVAPALRRLHKEVPIARTCASFAAEPYCRPFEHRRCYYCSFDSGATLGFKGTEPLAEDFAQEVRHVDSLRSPFCPSALNHFVATEHKVPLGVSVHEALTQAKITAQFQADHLARYGRLARVPVPLLVVQWPQKFTVALVQTLKPFLAATSFANLLRLIEPGLGALVYYYPSLPLRASAAAPDKVADLTRPAGALPERMGASLAERLDRLRGRVEPSETVDLWVDLLADMLLLGYFPFDTYCMGHCLQGQNLCIDGGCADTDSLVAMSAIGEDRYFNELFLEASLALALSISRYLRGTMAANHAHDVIVCSVWEDLHRRLRERLAGGESCDPRLERVVKCQGLFARLELFLGSILLGAVAPRGEIWV